jgi:DNA sulfur modification protein DndB
LAKEQKQHLPVFDTKADLETSQMAKLSAIKGRQFGKDVYSSVIKFKDLAKFLEIFPAVQRDIIPRKVASIRRYILSGLNSEDVNMRFFSSMTVTCKGTLFYDDNKNRVAIDTQESKLSINDGQHRYQAVITALEHLEKEFVKSKDKLRTSRIQNMIFELREMVIPIIIFDDLSESEEKQLFHDLNNLAQRPSRNANIRLNQTDLFSKMARELAQKNKYFVHYGVEMDKMSISGQNNPNTILLSTIYESIREILGAELKQDYTFLNSENYDGLKMVVDDTFSKLFYALPPDIDTRGKYITDKSYAIKAISRFICHARNYIDLQLSDQEIFDIIHSVDWTYNLDQWSKYGGVQGQKGNIVFGGGGGGGFRAIYSILMEKATGERPQGRRATVTSISDKRKKTELVR